MFFVGPSLRAQASAAAPPPPAVPTVYFAQAAGAYNIPVASNVLAKRDDFVAAVSNIGACNFGVMGDPGWDSGYPGSGMPTAPKLVSFDGRPGLSATITSTVGLAITGDASDGLGGITGRYNTSPFSGMPWDAQPCWLEFNNNITISLSTPVKAIGMFGVDWGDFEGKVVLTLAFADGSTYDIDTPLLPEFNSSASENDGNVLFVGFVSAKNIASIYIRSTTAGGAAVNDVFGIDDLLIADA